MRSLLLLVTFLTLVGCSSTLPVAPGRTSAKGDTLTVAALNKRIRNQPVTISLHDGKMIAARMISVTGDSCFFSTPDSVGRQALNLGQIARFERKDHIAGGISGFLLGGTGGLLLGAGVGALRYGSQGEWSGFGVAIVGGFGALIGITAGTIIGALNGNSFNYEIAATSGDLQLHGVDSSAVGNSQKREIRE